MYKKILLVVFAASVASFAGDTYIRNICDTLSNSSITGSDKKIELSLAYIDEIYWRGSKDLKTVETSNVTHHESFENLKPFRDKFGEIIPVKTKAGCFASTGNPFQYAEWNESQKKWILVEESGYATNILDVNMDPFAGYDGSNSYNILLLKEGSLPSNDSYNSDEVMVSKTFEFMFERWISQAMYSVSKETDQGVRTTYKMNSSVGLDSAETVQRVVSLLEIPETVSNVEVKTYHVVLHNPNVGQVESSSSANMESSSSVEQSSSSEETTGLGRMELTPRIFSKSREVRRLDGAKVKANEPLVPGVYYVKGLDGRWKKQVELPR